MARVVVVYALVTIAFWVRRWFIFSSVLAARALVSSATVLSLASLLDVCLGDDYDGYCDFVL